MSNSNHKITRTFDIAELALMIEAARLQAATALCCDSSLSRKFFQKEAAELTAMAPEEMLWFDSYKFYEIVTHIRAGEAFTIEFSKCNWKDTRSINVIFKGLNKIYQTEKYDFLYKCDGVERLQRFFDDYTPLQE